MIRNDFISLNLPVKGPHISGRHAALGLALIISSLFCSFAWPASFNCAAGELTPVEQMICHDAQLSDLDSKLALAYAGAKNTVSAADRPNLIATQRAWIARRNQCPDVSCVAAAYAARIKALSPSAEGAVTERSGNPARTDLYQLEEQSVTVPAPDTIGPDPCGPQPAPLKPQPNMPPPLFDNRMMSWRECESSTRPHVYHHSLVFVATGIDVKNNAIARISGKWDMDSFSGPVVLLDCAAKTKDGVAIGSGPDADLLQAACSIKFTVITEAQRRQMAKNQEALAEALGKDPDFQRMQRKQHLQFECNSTNPDAAAACRALAEMP